MIIHVIQPGDTIWSIAGQYNTSAQRIVADNALPDPERLVLGQALIILQPETIYTIQPGDTLTSIAAQFGTTVDVLLQNNPFLLPGPLRPGVTIVIDFQGEKRREITVNAYAYPFINRDVITRALPFLTYLTIFGYGFTPDGELIPPAIDEQPLINLAYTYNTAPVILLSSIAEGGTFSSNASLLFNNIELQNKVLDNILIVMRQRGYVGIDIDFEYVAAEDKEAFIRFLENVAARMHAQGYFVNTDLAPKTSAAQAGLLYEAHDYERIGAISDTVLLMTYEWGYTYGPPMAVAPINKVREVVSYGASVIPPYKIYMGMPNYGYDWTLPYIKGVSKAITIGNQTAIEIAMRYGAQIQFDETAQTPYFEYTDESGARHIVWFEDVRSMLAKFDLMDEYELLGAGYWNAMRPFAQNWALVSALYNIRKAV